jgi:hypothetical protein
MAGSDSERECVCEREREGGTLGMIKVFGAVDQVVLVLVRLGVVESGSHYTCEYKYFSE